MTTATTPPVAFATAFAALMRELLGFIAARFLRNPRLAPLIPLLWTRLTTSIRRMHATMARIAAGRPPRTSGGNTPSPKPRPKLPTGYAWLLRELKHEAAYIRTRLETLIADPETAALLAANPAAQRLLNPIRHALGHDTPRLTPRPPRIRPPRPQREKRRLPHTLMPTRPSLRKSA